MRKILSLTFLILYSTHISFSQNFTGALELQLNANNEVPFWLRTNKFGSTPLKGISTSFIGNIYRNYQDTVKLKKFDYGFGLEMRADIGSNTRFTVIEGYGKVKYDFLEVRGGRFKEFLGLVDSSLSMGSFSISGNALGIPKIELRVPEYWPRKGLISGRGNFAHGWYGSIPSKGTLAQTDSLYTYFHQKSLWIRVGRPQWKIKFYGGFVDNAYWGDEYKLHENFTMSNFQRYWSVISGKVWQGSKVGNHVGNLDAKIEYEFKKYKLSIYRQFFYEVGALWHLANIADGLVGVTFENKENIKSKITWSKILVEGLYTKNQAGETWSKPTPTGNENYLNHYIYNYGWSYKGKTLGLPMITTREDGRENLPSSDLEYHVNNRLWAINVGGLGYYYNWYVKLNLTFSKNFGTRNTADKFPKSDQFSWNIQSYKNVNKKYSYGFSLGGDHGTLLPMGIGLGLNIKKSFY